MANHLAFLRSVRAPRSASCSILSARVDRIAPSTAALLFVIYAALTGVTFSVLLLAYTGASIATTFVVTAGMFGALAVFGTTTKRSLAGVGQFFFMGLMGLILASIVGMFWNNDALQFLISVVGVIVFTGLTAWDAQRLKQMAVSVPAGARGSLRHRGGALSVPQLHQPVPLPAALHGRAS